jgi:hypothetical protein
MTHYRRDKQKQKFIPEAEERADQLLAWIADGEDVRDRLISLYVNQALLSDLSLRMLRAKRDVAAPPASHFWDDVWPKVLAAAGSRGDENTECDTPKEWSHGQVAAYRYFKNKNPAIKEPVGEYKVKNHSKGAAEATAKALRMLADMIDNGETVVSGGISISSYGTKTAVDSDLVFDFEYRVLVTTDIGSGLIGDSHE